MSPRVFSKLIFVTIIAFASVVSTVAQNAGPKLRYFDSDGKEVSNNEFVDIRGANPNYPDRTIVEKLDDGTTVFRLQKIPQEGVAAPDFSVTTVDGKVLRYSELKGKVIVLNFWFIGCPACRGMEPKLNAFKAKFEGNDDVVFLAITADSAASVKRYLAKEKFDYIQAVDAKPIIDSFVFRIYPKNIVIDRSGKIVYWRSTIAAWDKFESVVRTELAKETVASQEKR